MLAFQSHSVPVVLHSSTHAAPSCPKPLQPTAFPSTPSRSYINFRRALAWSLSFCLSLLVLSLHFRFLGLLCLHLSVFLSCSPLSSLKPQSNLLAALPLLLPLSVLDVSRCLWLFPYNRNLLLNLWRMEQSCPQFIHLLPKLLVYTCIWRTTTQFFKIW